jgi:hypothetical protein
MIAACIQHITGECPTCNSKMEFGMFPEHVALHCAPPCPDRCHVRVRPCNLEAHRLVCTQRPSACIYKKDGCNQVLPGAASMEAHVAECGWRTIDCTCGKAYISKDTAVHEAVCCHLQIVVARAKLLETEYIVQQQRSSMALLAAAIQKLEIEKVNRKRKVTSATRKPRDDVIAVSAAFTVPASHKRAKTDNIPDRSSNGSSNGSNGSIMKFAPPDAYKGFVVVSQSKHEEIPIYVARNEAGTYIISLRWIWNGRFNHAFTKGNMIGETFPSGMVRSPISAPRLGSTTVYFGTLEFFDYVLDCIDNRGGKMDCSTYCIRTMDREQILQAKQLLIDAGAKVKQPKTNDSDMQNHTECKGSSTAPPQQQQQQQQQPDTTYVAFAVETCTQNAQGHVVGMFQMKEEDGSYWMTVATYRLCTLLRDYSSALEVRHASCTLAGTTRVTYLYSEAFLRRIYTGHCARFSTYDFVLLRQHLALLDHVKQKQALELSA